MFRTWLIHREWSFAYLHHIHTFTILSSCMAHSFNCSTITFTRSADTIVIVRFRDAIFWFLNKPALPRPTPRVLMVPNLLDVIKYSFKFKFVCGYTNPVEAQRLLPAKFKARVCSSSVLNVLPLTSARLAAKLVHPNCSTAACARWKYHMACLTMPFPKYSWFLFLFIDTYLRKKGKKASNQNGPNGRCWGP